VVEYPTVPKQRPDRTAALRAAGLDPARKHVLNVGLFTPGKNQGEAFEIARLLPDVEFHFVGNTAGNFRDYWEPLIQSKPANCHVWGERSDVDAWYSACDLFLFTSIRELNPLVVKEAMAWGLPVVMHDLPVYCGGYKEGRQVSFLTADRERNAQIINERLK